MDFFQKTDKGYEYNVCSNCSTQQQQKYCYHLRLSRKCSVCPHVPFKTTKHAVGYITAVQCHRLKIPVLLVPVSPTFCATLLPLVTHRSSISWNPLLISNHRYHSAYLKILLITCMPGFLSTTAAVWRIW